MRVSIKGKSTGGWTVLRVAEQSDCLVSVSYSSETLNVDLLLCILYHIFLNGQVYLNTSPKRGGEGKKDARGPRLLLILYCKMILLMIKILP